MIDREGSAPSLNEGITLKVLKQRAKVERRVNARMFAVDTPFASCTVTPLWTEALPRPFWSGVESGPTSASQRTRAKSAIRHSGEASLTLHYSPSPADLMEIQLRRREHNQLGFAIQLCMFRLYARREETRSNHLAHLLGYLQKRNATAEDRRAALLSAIEKASTTDAGASIAGVIAAEFRNRNSLLRQPTSLSGWGSRRGPLPGDGQRGH